MGRIVRNLLSVCVRRRMLIPRSRSAECLSAAENPTAEDLVPQNVPVFSSKIQNSKKKFRHPHVDLNLDEIKNALRLLYVNGETNLMNLIRL